MAEKRIPSVKDNPKGLHKRYLIRKFVPGVTRMGRYKTKAVAPNAEYFVMRLDFNGNDRKHVLACRAAIQVYANEIEGRFPELAKDLRERYPALPPIEDGPLLKL